MSPFPEGFDLAGEPMIPVFESVGGFAGYFEYLEIAVEG
jgi:hypothetical protein